MSEETTDFGFDRVRQAEKASRVEAVFDSVVERYDLMNDLMSLGVHRRWKRFTVRLSGLRRGQRVMDLAGGTGDMALRFHERVGADGIVVLADVNARMLERARRRLIDAGIVGGIELVQADAEDIPFRDAWFDCVCVAFGLRNVSRKARALESIHRVLRPGGQALVLEFSHLTVSALKPLYDAYSFGVLPRLGALVAGDGDSYRYLAESIRVSPDQDALRDMMMQSGFERCDYHNLSAGIAAVHRGYKL